MWPKSVAKVEKGSRLGPLRQNLPPPPQPVRWTAFDFISVDDDIAM